MARKLTGLTGVGVWGRDLEPSPLWRCLWMCPASRQTLPPHPGKKKLLEVPAEMAPSVTLCVRVTCVWRCALSEGFPLVAKSSSNVSRQTNLASLTARERETVYSLWTRGSIVQKWYCKAFEAVKWVIRGYLQLQFPHFLPCNRKWCSLRYAVGLAVTCSSGRIVWYSTKLKRPGFSIKRHCSPISLSHDVCMCGAFKCCIFWLIGTISTCILY